MDASNGAIVNLEDTNEVLGSMEYSKEAIVRIFSLSASKNGPFLSLYSLPRIYILPQMGSTKYENSF